MLKKTTITIDIPTAFSEYMKNADRNTKLLQTALLVYPYIRKGDISYGKAAEVLGLNKLDLIALYSSVGIPFFDMTADEFDEEMQTVSMIAEQVIA